MLSRKEPAFAAPAQAPDLGAPQIDVADVDEVAALTAAQEVKARCAAILESDEAHGRERLARHLALETEFTVVDAIAALAASPRVPVAALACAPESVKAARLRQANDAFAKAYGRTEYTIPESQEEPESVVARMQANYALAQGLPARKQSKS